MRASSALAALFVGSIVGAGGGALAHRFVPISPFVRGLRVAGVRAPDSSVDTWLRARANEARSRTIALHAGEAELTATLAEIGLSIDVDATLARARDAGHRGSIATRLRESERARRGGVDVPWVVSFDERAARAKLAAFAPEIARAPADARLDLEHHAKTPERYGEELDVDASIAALRAEDLLVRASIDLVTRRVAPKVTLVDLTRVDVEKMVSSYETDLVLWGVGKNRAINIANAASKIDGLVLAPGAMMSFNDVVGPRTKERGFALAPEIQGDDMTTGYGGGTCQMSSTLHAAALFGALEIVERQAHSRPSHYTSMGLDATVSYPLADLKIRNTLSFPVLIHAFFPKPTTVRVEILGGDPVAKVDYAYGVSNTEDFLRRVVVKSNLPSGMLVKHQKGVRGFDVTSVVRIHYFDGREEEKTWFSGYRPAPEILWVSPDYDASALPPLPEHARGVEGMVSAN